MNRGRSLPAGSDDAPRMKTKKMTVDTVTQYPTPENLQPCTFPQFIFVSVVLEAVSSGCLGTANNDSFSILLS